MLGLSKADLEGMQNETKKSVWNSIMYVQGIKSEGMESG